MEDRKRLAILGGGFAGLWAAMSAVRQLDELGRRDGLDIVLVSDTPWLVMRPRLYEAAPRADALRVALDEVLGPIGVRRVEGRVEAIDPAARQLRLADGRTLGAAALVVALGSAIGPAPWPGAGHLFDVDTLEAALRLEAHLRELRARRHPGRGRAAVIGAGFTGLEVAAELAGRLRDDGDAAPVEVTLIEREAEIGPDLGAAPRPVIRQALAALGVRALTGARIADVDAASVTLADGRRIEAPTVIWTGGVRASGLAAAFPAARDSLGRLPVDETLALPGMEGIFIAGDMAAAPLPDGHRTLPSCQHALSLGIFAGANAARALVGAPPVRYAPADYVTCLDLGPWGALFTTGWERQVKFSGAEAKQIKRSINTSWIYPPTGDRTRILAAAALDRRRGG